MNETAPIPCPRCRGTGFEIRTRDDGVSAAAPCECSRRDQGERLVRDASIPRRYEHCSLETFEIIDLKTEKGSGQRVGDPDALRIAREQAADPARLREAAAAIKVNLDEAGLEEMIRLADLQNSTIYESAVDRAIQTLQREPLVEADEKAPRRTGINAILVDPDQATERKVSINQLLFANKRENVERVLVTVGLGGAWIARALPLGELLILAQLEVVRHHEIHPPDIRVFEAERPAP